MDKQIQDFNSADPGSLNTFYDFVIVQKRDGSTYRMNLTNSASASNYSSPGPGLTIFKVQKYIKNLPQVGESQGPRSNPAPQTPYLESITLVDKGVPITASSALVSFQHKGSGWPGLIFNYYDNPNRYGGHRYESYYERAHMRHQSLWMPLDDNAKINFWLHMCQWRSSAGDGHMKLYLHGFA
jgi:hypothetical protein